MIYLKTTDGRRMIVLEPANIKHMKSGAAVVSGDHAIAIMYTPDYERFQAEMISRDIIGKNGAFDAKAFDELVRESQSWPEVETRPKHPSLIVRPGDRGEA